MDRFVGGPGYRRGRPDRVDLRIGDALDFWRVEAIQPGHMMRLRAEMKMPGKGWLQYVVNSMGQGKSELVQTAYFAPKGLWGYVYWYSIFFIHRLIFDGLIDQIVAKVESETVLKKKEAVDQPLS